MVLRPLLLDLAGSDRAIRVRPGSRRVCRRGPRDGRRSPRSERRRQGIVVFVIRKETGLLHYCHGAAVALEAIFPLKTTTCTCSWPPGAGPRRC